jgi:hypothetical protein
MLENLTVAQLFVEISVVNVTRRDSVYKSSTGPFLEPAKSSPHLKHPIYMVGKPEGKRPLGRQRRRCEEIGMELREIGWGCRVDSVVSG